MYCIATMDFNSRYLCFQDTGNGVEYGYFLADSETLLLNLPNHSKKHPTIFKSKKQADDFIKWIASVRGSELCGYFSERNLFPEWMESRLVPNCGMECQKCNKKNKHKCHNLRNPYQNYCSYCMARFEHGFSPYGKMPDDVCSECLTEMCAYNYR